MAWYYNKLFDLPKLKEFKNISVVSARECLRKYEKPCRFLGLDYGSQHVGLAISDVLQTKSIALCTLNFMNTQQIARYLLYNDKLRGLWRRPSLLVVGYPLEKDGTEGEQCAKVLKFLTSLCSHSDVSPFDDVLLWDERMSTCAVYYEKFLPNDLHRRWSGMKRKQIVDQEAAKFILQDALDALIYYRQNPPV